MRSTPSALTSHQLLAWRTRHGWTQTQLAEALGRSLRTIQYYEAGTVRIPLQTAILLGMLRPNGIAPRRRPFPGLGSLRSLRPGTGPGSRPSIHSTEENFTTQKGDISELEKRGHLCFGLTHD